MQSGFCNAFNVRETKLLSAPNSTFLCQINSKIGEKCRKIVINEKFGYFLCGDMVFILYQNDVRH